MRVEYPHLPSGMFVVPHQLVGRRSPSLSGLEAGFASGNCGHRSLLMAQTWGQDKFFATAVEAQQSEQQQHNSPMGALSQNGDLHHTTASSTVTLVDGAIRAPGATSEVDEKKIGSTRDDHPVQLRRTAPLSVHRALPQHMSVRRNETHREPSAMMALPPRGQRGGKLPRGRGRANRRGRDPRRLIQPADDLPVCRDDLDQVVLVQDSLEQQAAEFERKQEELPPKDIIWVGQHHAYAQMTGRICGFEPRQQYFITPVTASAPWTLRQATDDKRDSRGCACLGEYIGVQDNAMRCMCGSITSEAHELWFGCLVTNYDPQNVARIMAAAQRTTARFSTAAPCLAFARHSVAGHIVEHRVVTPTTRRFKLDSTGDVWDTRTGVWLTEHWHNVTVLLNDTIYRTLSVEYSEQQGICTGRFVLSDIAMPNAYQRPELPSWVVYAARDRLMSAEAARTAQGPNKTDQLFVMAWQEVAEVSVFQYGDFFIGFHNDIRDGETCYFPTALAANLLQRLAFVDRTSPGLIKSLASYARTEMQHTVPAAIGDRVLIALITRVISANLDREIAALAQINSHSRQYETHKKLLHGAEVTPVNASDLAAGAAIACVAYVAARHVPPKIVKACGGTVATTIGVYFAIDAVRKVAQRALRGTRFDTTMPNAGEDARQTRWRDLPHIGWAFAALGMNIKGDTCTPMAAGEILSEITTAAGLHLNDVSNPIQAMASGNRWRFAKGFIYHYLLPMPAVVRRAWIWNIAGITPVGIVYEELWKRAMNRIVRGRGGWIFHYLECCIYGMQAAESIAAATLNPKPENIVVAAVRLWQLRLRFRTMGSFHQATADMPIAAGVTTHFAHNCVAAAAQVVHSLVVGIVSAFGTLAQLVSSGMSVHEAGLKMQEMAAAADSNAGAVATGTMATIYGAPSRTYGPVAPTASVPELLSLIPKLPRGRSVVIPDAYVLTQPRVNTLATRTAIHCEVTPNFATNDAHSSLSAVVQRALAAPTHQAQPAAWRKYVTWVLDNFETFFPPADIAPISAKEWIALQPVAVRNIINTEWERVMTVGTLPNDMHHKIFPKIELLIKDIMKPRAITANHPLINLLTGPTIKAVTRYIEHAWGSASNCVYAPCKTSVELGELFLKHAESVFLPSDCAKFDASQHSGFLALKAYIYLRLGLPRDVFRYFILDISKTAYVAHGIIARVVGTVGSGAQDTSVGNTINRCLLDHYLLREHRPVVVTGGDDNVAIIEKCDAKMIAQYVRDAAQLGIEIEPGCVASGLHELSKFDFFSGRVFPCERLIDGVWQPSAVLLNKLGRVLTKLGIYINAPPGAEAALLYSDLQSRRRDYYAVPIYRELVTHLLSTVERHLRKQRLAPRQLRAIDRYNARCHKNYFLSNSELRPSVDTWVCLHTTYDITCTDVYEFAKSIEQITSYPASLHLPLYDRIFAVDGIPSATYEPELDTDRVGARPEYAAVSVTSVECTRHEDEEMVRAVLRY